jgi:hypothetical protein
MICLLQPFCITGLAWPGSPWAVITVAYPGPEDAAYSAGSLQCNPSQFVVEIKLFRVVQLC